MAVSVDLAMAAAESAAWSRNRNRYGTSFKQGFRLGWRDGLAHAGASWVTLTDQQRAEHIEICAGTCVFCEDHRTFGACTKCGSETEALGADELSRCCGSRVTLRGTE